MQSTSEAVEPVLGGPFAAVDAGGRHACAIRTDGSAVCWGVASDGQLGNGMVAAWAPQQVILPGSVVDVFTGRAHACAIAGGATRQLYCWGDNESRQLGFGSTGEPIVATPTAVPGRAGTASGAAGSRHTCVVSSSSVWCWGDNGSGQLGDGTTTSRATPAEIPALMGRATNSGADFTCAMSTTNTTTSCWGNNRTGQMGDGGGLDARSPRIVANGLSLMRLAAGDLHVCELRGTTAVPTCWGENTDGQLGNGRTQPIEQLQSVVTTTSGTFASIVAGSAHTCGSSTAGLGYCWGLNYDGQVGDGTRQSRSEPVLVAVPGSNHDFGLGTTHTCVATSAGNYCWGANRHGELGDGTALRRSSPTPVQTLPVSGVMAAGDGFTCALTQGNQVFCWGDNSRGQLGQGSASRSLAPDAVSFP